MKNLILSLIVLFTLASCSQTKRTASHHTYDDAYYSPSLAKKEAQKRAKEEALNPPSKSVESSSSLESAANTEKNESANDHYYGDNSRMSYSGYYSRFGTGFHPGFAYAPMPMYYNPYMMRSPYMGMGYNRFGGMGGWNVGIGYGMGNGMMGYPYYDPFFDPWCPYGGMMGFGYNPYMMSPMMNYNMGYNNGYMAGSMMYGSGSGGQSSFKQQPTLVRRTTYGTNNRTVATGSRSSNYGAGPNNTAGSSNVNNTGTRQSLQSQSGTAPRNNQSATTGSSPSRGSSGVSGSSSQGRQSPGSSSGSYSRPSGSPSSGRSSGYSRPSSSGSSGSGYNSPSAPSRGSSGSSGGGYSSPSTRSSSGSSSGSSSSGSTGRR